MCVWGTGSTQRRGAGAWEGAGLRAGLSGALAALRMNRALPGGRMRSKGKGGGGWEREVGRPSGNGKDCGQSTKA